MNLHAVSRSRAENEDFEGQLRDAQQQLEVLQHQREQLERQKCEMDELNQRKEEFLDGQIELTERLSGSVTTIDRELFELRQELEDLEQTRQSFAAHLIRIEKVEPEGWQRESFTTELSRALCMLEQAEEVIVCSVNPDDRDHLDGAEFWTHLARYGVIAIPGCGS